MKVQSWLMFLACAGLLASLCRPVVVLPTPSLAPRASSRVSRFVGAGSCAASACHNGNFTHGPTSGSEYTFWITRDPHARAYETLFDDRSKQIQKNLQRTTPAHEEQRCLRCHVAPDYDVSEPPPDAPYLKRDGVSCESCHGPAKEWLALHHLDDWRLKPAPEKLRLGMTDTQSIAGRAQLCAQCHVGAPGMDVDHDLLAAGHPRLHFEFAAFHAQLPRHWPDTKDRNGRPDFEARVWAVGQLAVAQLALELLADRALDKKKPWPEFAEHDCAACHHDLRAFGSPRKGTPLPWGAQVGLTPQAMDILRAPDDAAKFRAAFAALQAATTTPGTPNRAEVAKHAGAAALLLKPLVANLERKRPADLQVNRALETLLVPEICGTVDGATQRNLAIAALRLAAGDLKTVLPADLRDALRRRTIDEPKTYEPEAIQKRLLEWKNRGFKKGPVK